VHETARFWANTILQKPGCSIRYSPHVASGGVLGVRMPKPIYLILGAFLIVAVAAVFAWWRSGWTMSPTTQTALREIFWLSCLLWGFLLMISAATEGFPYTSIHIRNDLTQDVVGGLGLLLAVFGVYYGFAIGQKKKH
jgi:hypothetical protein